MKQLFTFFFVLIISIGLFSQEQYSKVRISLLNTDLSELSSLGIDLSEGILKKGTYFETDLSQSEIQKLTTHQISTEILIKDVSKFYADRALAEKNKKVIRNTDDEWVVPENWEYGSMGGFYTLEEAYAELDSMFAMYPNLITQRQPINNDFLTHDGRNLYWVKISDNPGTDEDEPELLYTGVHHAREPIGVQQNIFFMWYLLENYNSNDEIKRIVDNTELYFVPIINVDGYAYNELTNPGGGGMWRKNRRNNGDGSYGVDVNRNYDYYWGLDNIGSSPNPSDETYRGPTPFSEPSIKNIRDFCNDHQFLIALNYHSYGNLLLSPWGYTEDLPPDNDLFMAYGELLTRENNFVYGPGSTTIYPTNGGSDDWMYGEQDTKNMIVSYTPEVGNDNDGFWPSVSRIIPLCQKQMWQNLTAAKLVGQYGVVKDISPMVTDVIDNYASFTITRLGLANTETFTVSISPLDDHMVDAGDPKEFNNMELLASSIDSITYTLDAGIESGTIYRYLLSIDNGIFVVSDTITKVYGTEVNVFEDDCENMDNWTSSKWATTGSDYHSPANSITDSPFGDYQSNENNTITLDTLINLGVSPIAFLRFWAKWDIEKGYDYVQVMAKENGSNTWIPLHGKYSSYGNYYLDPEDPVYDGTQTEWVHEEIDLSDFAGKEITLRFRLFSDYYVEGDGFYFDDLTISVITSTTGIQPSKRDNLFVSRAFPNPANNICNIKYQLVRNDHARLDLIDALGNVINTYQVPNKHGVIKLDVGNLSNGIYYYRIVNGNNESKTYKLIKY